MFKKTNSPLKSSMNDLSLELWDDMTNHDEPWGLFKETRKNVDKADTNAAIRSLTEIINMPGLDSKLYLQAYYFLNKLVAFSEKYFDLYGVKYERNASLVSLAEN